MKSTKPVIIVLITLFLIGSTIQVPIHSNSNNTLQDTSEFIVSQNEWLPEQYSQSFGTFLGGDGDEDRGSIAISDTGEIVVAFLTQSTDMTTTTNAYQNEYNGIGDCFVAKFTAQGSLVFATYLGGNETDFVNSVAITNEGNIVITGWTRSSDYPITAGSIQETHGGDIDGFITILSGNGQSLVASSFLGGEGEDVIHGCEFDSSNNIVFTGYSTSDGLGTTGVYQEHKRGLTYDVIVGRVDSDIENLMMLTYWGSDSEDRGYALAIDDSDNIFVSGYTVSLDFPLVNEMQDTFEGVEDIILAKFDADCEDLLLSTYIGGDDQDNPKSMTIDPDGNPIIVGFTRSPNLPMVNAIQDIFGGNQDLFIVKYRADCQGIMFSTFWGGSGFEGSWGVTSDSTGRILVHGDTSSTDFDVATTESFELGGSRDGFVTLFENDGQSVNCSFIVGGDNVEYTSATAIDSDGNIYITGKTKSVNFPILNAHQSTKGDGYDFYVCKFSPSSDTIPQTDLLLEIVIVSSILGAILVIGIVLKKRG